MKIHFTKLNIMSSTDIEKNFEFASSLEHSLKVVWSNNFRFGQVGKLQSLEK